jgi:hypothetical protein
MINLNWQPGMTLESIEKEAILQAMRYYRGNKTATANALGFAIRTLDAKLTKYQEDAESKKQRDEERHAREQDFIKRSRGIGQTIKNPDQRRADGTFREEGSKAALVDGVESASEVPEKQPVPLSERQKVQGVSSQHASRSGQTRRG